MILQTVRAPFSHPVDIDELRPTQITIRQREVEVRAAKLKKILRTMPARQFASTSFPWSKVRRTIFM